jgi:hypothetical protein
VQWYFYCLSFISEGSSLDKELYETVKQGAHKKTGRQRQRSGNPQTNSFAIPAINMLLLAVHNYVEKMRNPNSKLLQAIYKNPSTTTTTTKQNPKNKPNKKHNPQHNRPEVCAQKPPTSTSKKRTCLFFLEKISSNNTNFLI